MDKLGVSIVNVLGMDISREDVLARISSNNMLFEPSSVRNALIVFECDNHYIGDTCVTFSRLRGLQAFLPNSRLSVNSIRNFTLCSTILGGNPFLSELFCVEWNKFNFLIFDLIIVISEEEDELCSAIQTQISSVECLSQFNGCVFSYSNILRKNERSPVFSFFYELSDWFDEFDRNALISGPEIFLSAGEMRWGNDWLLDRGISEQDSLVILVDSASKREKMVDIHVYFDLVLFLASLPNFRILVFDELNWGKRDFYSSWLGDESLVADKMIFAEGLSLREAFSLISSRYVKHIIGPCTGLMHCSSGIYNVLKNGCGLELDIPNMIVYAGADMEGEFPKWHWWGKSLVSCIILRQTSSGKEVYVVKDFFQEGCLPTKHFTSDLLIGFLRDRLPVS